MVAVELEDLTDAARDARATVATFCGSNVTVPVTLMIGEAADLDLRELDLRALREGRRVADPLYVEVRDVTRGGGRVRVGIRVSAAKRTAPATRPATPTATPTNIFCVGLIEQLRIPGQTRPSRSSARFVRTTPPRRIEAERPDPRDVASGGHHAEDVEAAPPANPDELQGALRGREGARGEAPELRATPYIVEARVAVTSRDAAANEVEPLRLAVARGAHHTRGPAFRWANGSSTLRPTTPKIG